MHSLDTKLQTHVGPNELLQLHSGSVGYRVVPGQIFGVGDEVQVCIEIKGSPSIQAHPAHNTQDIGLNSEYNALQVLWADGLQVLEHTRKTMLARELTKLVTHRYNINSQHEKNTA